MAGQPCETYARKLVKIFDDACGKDKLTPEAREHLKRVAEYTVCFHLNCTENKSSSWWEAKGEKYYRERVETLVKDYLGGCSDEQITCDQLQKAINEYADDVERFLRRWQRRRKREAVRRELVGGDAASSGDDDLMIFLGCPFTVHRR